MSSLSPQINQTSTSTQSVHPDPNAQSNLINYHVFSQLSSGIPASPLFQLVHAHDHPLPPLPKYPIPMGSSTTHGQQMAMTANYILAILDEHDKYTFRDLLNEICTLLSPILGPSPLDNPPLLTYERILEMITPCILGQSSGKSMSH